MFKIKCALGLLALAAILIGGAELMAGDRAVTSADNIGRAANDRAASGTTDAATAQAAAVASQATADAGTNSIALIQYHVFACNRVVTDNANGTGTVRFDLVTPAYVGRNGMVTQSFGKVWTATSAFGVASTNNIVGFTLGGGTGTVFNTVTANSEYDVITSSSARLAVDLDRDADGTTYLHFQVGPQIFMEPVAITGN